MIYVLKSRPYLSFDSMGDGYFTGETYMFQKERYAVCSHDIEKAKSYQSLKRAISACEKSFSRFENYIFDVVSIENGEEIEVYKII